MSDLEKEFENRISIIEKFLWTRCVQCELYRKVKEQQEADHKEALNIAREANASIIKWYQCLNCLSGNICEDTKFCPDCGIRIERGNNEKS